MAACASLASAARDLLAAAKSMLLVVHLVPKYGVPAGGKVVGRDSVGS